MKKVKTEKKQLRVYLAGAIEKAPDQGKTWRRNISEFLKNDLGHSVWDPTIEEFHFMTDEEKQNFRKWKSTDTKRFYQIVRKIIEKDLDHLINKTDYVIAYYDEYVLGGGGTQGEITMGYHYKIPIYLVHNIPIDDLSSWIVGCSSAVFDDFEKLKIFLKKIYK